MLLRVLVFSFSFCNRVNLPCSSKQTFERLFSMRLLLLFIQSKFKVTHSMGLQYSDLSLIEQNTFFDKVSKDLKGR